ncbi:MAG TPA: DinB family protein [Candidatus Acidoferrales bacterium]|nr:DinB family protein [Candidatus Acidoferrales bacterium]
MDEKTLREQIGEMLNKSEAHVDWKEALEDVPAKLRGVRPAGSPHSLWELLEHVRIAQWDILEFSRDPKHVSPDFPSGYWPESPAPPSEAAWDKSVKDFLRDVDAMGKLLGDPKADLLKPIPHGSGQTILREALLAADHSAYHLGQFVLIRRLLGNWDG